MTDPELRQDAVSGNWAIIAPSRAHRSDAAAKCPFDDLSSAADTNGVIARYGEGEQWRVGVIGNLYPALKHGDVCAVITRTGPYQKMQGVGRHELIITKDHKKNIQAVPLDVATEVLIAVADRVKAYKQDECLEYFLFLQNCGPRAGASQEHPHFQIIATPIIPPGVAASLEHSRKYFEINKKCLHCEAIEHERSQKVRVIYENEDAIVFAPFASTYQFELRIFPKKHSARFELASQHELSNIADALQKALGALMKAGKKPDYNFLLHTAPLKNDAGYQLYHWHIEIMPRIQTFAGFEIGTGMIINQLSPEVAAELLRKAL